MKVSPALTSHKIDYVRLHLSSSQGKTNALDPKEMARPERFELPTFWFVAIQTFVDLAQLTNHFGLKKTLQLDPTLDPRPKAARLTPGVAGWGSLCC